jgi:molybdopterin/thiamine biosynthesis adenylyltransferase
MALKEDQIERYSRHILLEHVGGEGQEKLLSSKVLVVGTGGLGSPISLYLAAAGVGTLGLVDHDVVDLSNLQRQILHQTKDIARRKVESGKESINALNPDVEVITYPVTLNAENAERIIGGYDFIVEGTDNFASKFLINDACVLFGKPFSQGGILRFQGQTITHMPGAACYRCVYLQPPPAGSVPTCSEAGVLGAIAGMLGTIQAAEVIKSLLGIGTTLENRLLTFNALDMSFRTIDIKRNPNCPVCGKNPSITELHDIEQPICDLPA